MAVHKQRMSDLSIKRHEVRIRDHLYEEGPTSSADLQQMLGISMARTMDILSAMRTEGIVEQSYLRPGKSYWLLAEDLQDVA